MIIRKTFSVESAHIVRNMPVSKVCSNSWHGHSAVIEVFLTANSLDIAETIVDFGLVKKIIKPFINSFDHCIQFHNKESDEVKEFFKKQNKRWIELPCSPTAESLSLLMLFVIDKLLEHTEYNNGEDKVRVSSVRYHETTTGYAEAFREDLKLIKNKYQIKDIIFSDGVKEDEKLDLIFPEPPKNTIKIVQI